MAEDVRRTGEGKSYVIAKESKKKAAFTLAEVLITLGIIGVVAAMTIPTLLTNYREKMFVNKLKESYSIFSQAYKMAVYEYDSPEGWDIGTGINMDSAVKVYEYLKPYLKLGIDCGSTSGCFASGYKTLSGVSYGYAPRNHSMYARGMLLNGASFAIASAGTYGCKYHDALYPLYCGVLYIDVNGLDKPNQAGVDYFGFFITPNGIEPMGKRGWNGGGNGYTCKYQATNSGNGTGCTAWVLEKGNMEYLHRDISDEWKALQ
jgi:prepilin-type N-terminal cleavage/methylation domain-containing protein